MVTLGCGKDMNDFVANIFPYKPSLQLQFSQIKNKNTTWSINTPLLKYEQRVSTLNQDVVIFRGVAKEF